MNSGKSRAVLRLTPHFHREGSWPVAFDPVGGLQIQTFGLTRGLDALGARQTVVTSYIPGSPRRQPLGRFAEVVSVGPAIPPALAGPLLSFSWFLGVLRLLGAGRHRHDLAHIHFNHSIWCRVLLLLLRATRRPVVVTLNTALWGGLQRAFRLEGSIFDLTLWIERMALKSADRVVALTESGAQFARIALRVPADGIVVIPDAVAAEEFQARPEPRADHAFRSRHAIPQNWRIVSYVGRISDEKGWRDLPYLVGGLASRRVFLLICGDGPDRRKLEAAFRSAECRSGWAITGFLPPSATRQAMRLTDVLILPSRREVFGSVLLEAMASGVPTVAYRVGGIVDVAGEPPAVSLAKPGDRSDMLSRILAVLDEPGLARELAARGAERVKSFTLERSVALTDALYDDLLCERGQAKGGGSVQSAE